MNRSIGLLVLIGCLSCEVESSEIGSDFFTGGSIDLSYIDSATVKLSTIKFDQLVTNSSARILAGSYPDEKIGRVTAKPFIQLSAPSLLDIDLEAQDPVFDYLALVLKYDEYFYGDTTQQLTLYVHRLSEDITANNSGYLYNTTTFSSDENQLGSISFLPKPRREDSIEINLSVSLGNEILQKILENDEDITSNSEFIEYFQGLAVVPDTTTATSIIGFTKAPELRLYYKDKSVVPSVRKYISFPATSGFVSSWIHSNRSETLLAALQSSRQKISAEETNDESYLQAGVGLALRVDMPHLRSLTQLENFDVAKAILELYPVRKSYTTSYPLPDNLIVYKHGRRNEVYGALEQAAILFEDVALNRDTNYQLDVTEFVKEQMALEEFNENGLVFVTDDTDYRSGVDRLYMASPGYEYKTRVRIYFVTLGY